MTFEAAIAAWCGLWGALFTLALVLRVWRQTTGIK